MQINISMITVSLSIESKSFNNKWPSINVYLNNDLLDTVVCEKHVELHYQAAELESNILSIELFNKNFGDENQWDVDSDGHGLEAKITDIKLNDVSIGTLLSSSKFKTNWTPAQLQYSDKGFIDEYSDYHSDGWLTFNGTLTFEFSAPVYDFLIEKKYKVPYDPSIAFFSNNTELFHYDAGLKNLEEIKNIIASHD